MTAENSRIFGALLLAAGLGGCAMSDIPRPDLFGATHAAQSGATTLGNSADERIPGVSDAVKAPLRDFNLIEDDVPLVLVRAYAHPYDVSGLTGCAEIQAQISALDLALGPDVDIPGAASHAPGMLAQGRGLAAEGALDAVRSATTGVIPVRSWVRRLSGATYTEKELKAVALSGAVRRGFLKALGLQRGCEWPAAPLDLRQAALKEKTLTAAQRTALGGVPTPGGAPAGAPGEGGGTASAPSPR